MCLAIPMQITQIDGFMARCAARGVTRDVSLFLLQDETIQIGDHVGSRRHDLARRKHHDYRRN